MYSLKDTLENYDKEIWSAIEREYRRQEEHIELIASENYASPRVLHAQGSVLTNKYAEGYPGKRYYGGCEYVDIAEQLAIDRAKALFGAGYANVQPHSGAQANQAVYLRGAASRRHDPRHVARTRRPSDARRAVNISGRYFDVGRYGLDPETEAIDYAEVEELAHVKKAEAHRRGRIGLFARDRLEALSRDRGSSAARCFMADIAHYAGLDRGRPLSEPGRRRRLRDEHHPQDACAVRAAG